MSENTKKRKVCIVDDEPSIREVYQTALEQSGFEVVTAADGEEGLRIAAQEKPDILLIDIMMPKMDGIEMMRALRANPELQQIPIIVMTNVDDQKIIKETAEFETNFYLIKSMFEPKKVVAIVDEVLHNK